MEILILIMLIMIGAVIYSITKDEPRLNTGFYGAKILQKAVIARALSNQDFEIEMIGIDLVRANNRIQELSDSDKEELEKLKIFVAELNGKMDYRLGQLGILSEVEAECIRVGEEYAKNHKG